MTNTIDIQGATKPAQHPEDYILAIAIGTPWSNHTATCPKCQEANPKGKLPTHIELPVMPQIFNGVNIYSKHSWNILVIPANEVTSTNRETTFESHFLEWLKSRTLYPRSLTAIQATPNNVNSVDTELLTTQMSLLLSSTKPNNADIKNIVNIDHGRTINMLKTVTTSAINATPTECPTPA
jgi:hypothetical protein